MSDSTRLDQVYPLVDVAYLRSHPDEIFVFGDNLERWGRGGAAAVRGEPNAYGFVAKKAPKHADHVYFRPDECREVYTEEIQKLIRFILRHPDQKFLIWAGLANKYGIFEAVMEPSMKRLIYGFKNVVFLW
jgi:hypothetical protein